MNLVFNILATISASLLLGLLNYAVRLLMDNKDYLLAIITSVLVSITITLIVIIWII